MIQTPRPARRERQPSDGRGRWEPGARAGRHPPGVGIEAAIRAARGGVGPGFPAAMGLLIPIRYVFCPSRRRPPGLFGCWLLAVRELREPAPAGGHGDKTKQPATRARCAWTTGPGHHAAIHRSRGPYAQLSDPRATARTGLSGGRAPSPPKQRPPPSRGRATAGAWAERRTWAMETMPGYVLGPEDHNHPMHNRQPPHQIGYPVPTLAAAPAAALRSVAAPWI